MRALLRLRKASVPDMGPGTFFYQVRVEGDEPECTNEKGQRVFFEADIKVTPNQDAASGERFKLVVTDVGAAYGESFEQALCNAARFARRLAAGLTWLSSRPDAQQLVLPRRCDTGWFSVEQLEEAEEEQPGIDDGCPPDTSYGDCCGEGGADCNGEST